MLSIRQSHVHAGTPENEEEYTMRNIKYIKFQTCYILLWGVSWSRDSLDVVKFIEIYL